MTAPQDRAGETHEERAAARRPTPVNTHEIDLLTEVAGIIRQAQAEYRGDFKAAARLEISAAQRLLDRVFRGGV